VKKAFSQSYPNNLDEKMSRLLLLVIYLLILSLRTDAQEVTFVRQPQLLNPVSGFTAYADCTVDMNGDLLDDVVRTGNKGIYIDFQKPDGHYSQRFFPIAIVSPPSWSICSGDLDNDGFNDLLFGHLGTISFVHASDDGQEYNETVMPGFIVSQRSTLADINNDGWLDAFVCNDTARSIPYLNDGSGNMSPDIALLPTANLPGSYAAIWTDYDNDHDTDLYLTKCLGGAPVGDSSRINLLYQNNGNATFEEVGHFAGVDDNAQSWSTSFEDFDNDGDFDAFIVNHDMQNRLYRNNGNGTFTDVISSSGINALDLGAWENASGDFNNDGFMDIFSELTSELYIGNCDLTFTGQDAPVTPGAIADLNHDGFLDVCKGGQVWLNEGNENHWLKIIPRGIVSNRSGIGSRIEIYGAWGKQIREIRSGQSYSPMSSLTAHFGLGSNNHVDSIKIFWPSGMETTLFNLMADSTYFIPEVKCLIPGKNEIIILPSSTNICPGDTTILFVPDGYASYLWSDNQTQKSIAADSEGNYFVISIDSAGCGIVSETIEITMLVDLPPIIYSQGGNVICQNDTLQLIASPGNNYMWSDGTSGTATLEVSESGLYTVAVDAQCSDDQLFSDPFEVIVLPADQPEIINSEILPGDSIRLTADRPDCQWYDVPVGGTVLANGSVFVTKAQGPISRFYVESVYEYDGVNMTGGMPDTTGEGGISTQSGYLYFTSQANFTLLSVDIFVPTGAPLNNRFVQLWKEDSLIAFRQFTVINGLNTLELDFHVEPGNYTLRCPQGNLWRNSGSLHFPYQLGNAGQITSSSFGNGFYYYFYNWKIITDSTLCTSDRLEVEVILTANEETRIPTILNIFPNPCKDFISIVCPDEMGRSHHISVMDLNGKVLFQKYSDTLDVYTLDMSNILPGLYTLQVISQNQCASTRFIKQ
jgi:hypothetical protein